jgi:hypothetical protein
MTDSNQNEQYLASAVQYLLEGDEIDAAKLLASSSLDGYWETQHTDRGYSDDPDAYYPVCEIKLRGSRKFYEAISISQDSPNATAIKRAFNAVLGTTYPVIIIPSVSLVSFEPDWRARLLADQNLKEITNQNPYAKKPLYWENMRFNSPPEIEIAKALDRIGVMYLPNCLARLGTPGHRECRIPDFLICYKNRWGILEVDGKTYHTGRASEDHDRSRLIEKQGGIVYYTRYDAMRCQNKPDEVVSEFLEILGSR